MFNFRKQPKQQPKKEYFLVARKLDDSRLEILTKEQIEGICANEEYRKYCLKIDNMDDIPVEALFTSNYLRKK